MKTLIMNKIEEREAFIFRRIIHRNEQFKKGLYSFRNRKENKLGGKQNGKICRI